MSDKDEIHEPGKIPLTTYKVYDKDGNVQIKTLNDDDIDEQAMIEDDDSDLELGDDDDD